MRRKNYYKPYGGRKKLTWKRVLLVFLALGVALFCALEGAILVNSRTDIKGEPEVMVVFGCMVYPWGPSILLQDRLEAALDYLEDHPDMTVVVNGGQGTDEPVAEARAMYDYLVENGVDGGNILVEDLSNNTWQNVNYTLDLLQEEGHDTAEGVLLVSNSFHLLRIEMLWERATGTGENISTLAAPTSHMPSAVKMFFREPLAVVKSFVFDR